MIKDNIKSLLCCIAVVLVLLSVCMTLDYATNVTSNCSDVVEVNDTLVSTDDGSSFLVVSSKDKVHTVSEKVNEKKKCVPTISMWAKPSVRCGYPYKWYYRTFVDYCPNCHHYNCLLKNPKGVPENEYTCAICDSDFDGVVGKEKYSWSNVYLRKA